MSADSTTRAGAPSAYPAVGWAGMGQAGRRRWTRRLVTLASVAGGLALYRERKLAENARRFGLPG